ncbi:MAG: hypothetical protein ACYDAK_05380 [Candidatus Limnocylindrales bacterium]
MAAGTAPVFYATPKTAATAFTNATGTTVTAIYTAGASGALILGIEATTSDTAPNDCNLYVKIGGAGSFINIGGKRVPAGAGNIVASATAAVQLLDVGQLPFLLPDGSLQLGPNDVLGLGVVAAVTAAKQLNVVVQAGDF